MKLYTSYIKLTLPKKDDLYKKMNTKKKGIITWSQEEYTNN